MPVLVSAPVTIPVLVTWEEGQALSSPVRLAEVIIRCSSAGDKAPNSTLGETSSKGNQKVIWVRAC